MAGFCLPWPALPCPGLVVSSLIGLAPWSELAINGYQQRPHTLGMRRLVWSVSLVPTAPHRSIAEYSDIITPKIPLSISV